MAIRRDKRAYEFLERNDEAEASVKKRIPDATLGLRSYDDSFLKRGFTCEDSDCIDDHGEMQPDERLSKKELLDMTYDRKCGLVVDGVWGAAELLFPFAVYEAKKRSSSYQEAEKQVYHACRTYLAMLDDLARNPNNVSEYQTEESFKYQLFGFVSCGPVWEVFAAWNWLGSCVSDISNVDASLQK